MCIFLFSTSDFNNCVENSVSKVENFTLFTSKTAQRVEKSVFINVLDRIFHIGKKKPLQLKLSCKGFFLYVLSDFFVLVGIIFSFPQRFEKGVKVGVFYKLSHFV